MPHVPQEISGSHTESQSEVQSLMAHREGSRVSTSPLKPSSGRVSVGGHKILIVGLQDPPYSSWVFKTHNIQLLCLEPCDAG